jgi:Icc-related predicted phosphoesterase
MPITIIQITDSHIPDIEETFLNNIQPILFLKRIIQHISYTIKHPDALVFTGDITHDGTELACQHLISILKNVSCPIYITLGNHDSLQIIEQHLINDKITLPNVVDLPHWQIIFADSHVEGQVTGKVSKTGLNKITTQVRYNNKPAIIFTHHPPIIVNSLWLDKLGMLNGDSFLQSISAHNCIKCVAFGHIHQQWQGEYKHIELLAAPSSAAQFKPGSREFALDKIDPGYRIFSLDDSGHYESEVVRVCMQIKKVLSGGQTGVDRAALDTAIRLAIPHGGWCPKGRKALDGEIDEIYQLTETPSADYPQRTEWNVRDSDATLILSWGQVSGGTALTCKLAEKMAKPLLIIDLCQTISKQRFNQWLKQYNIITLNIAGPRHSVATELYDKALNAALFLLT